MKTGFYKASIENGVQYIGTEPENGKHDILAPEDFLESLKYVDTVFTYLDNSLEYDQEIFEIIEEEYGIQ